MQHLAAATTPPLSHSHRDSLAELAYELTVTYGIRLRLVLPHGHELPVQAHRRPQRSRLADELTAAELRIARLVAAGASNRDIAQWRSISTKTVEAHLSHIYRKLGVRCRVDLTRLVAEEEPARG